MLTILFVATTAICAAEWLINHIACAGLVYYIEKNGYKLPNEKESGECTRYAAKKIFKL